MEHTFLFKRSCNKEFVVAGFFIFIVTYAYSLFLAPYHFAGDQEHYNNAYSAITGYSLLNAFEIYQTKIFTVEPGHFFIIWIFSQVGLEKNIVMAAANSLLAVLLFLALRKKGNGLPISFLLVFSNYYLMAMFFTLERTKFAFIFLLLFLVMRKYYFLVLAAISHTFILIPVFFYLFAQYLCKKKLLGKGSVRTHLISLAKFACLTIVSYLIWLYFGVQFVDKFSSYNEEKQMANGVGGLQVLVMLVFTMLSTNRRKEAFVYFILLFALETQIGATRVNMLAYFSFLFYSEASNRNYKLFSLIVAPYFIYKCYVYFDAIVTWGG
ncbi:MAG: hypothetical protein RL571_3024 [Pseudomonadota bacterium]|jgi:hypothetical protein